MDFNNSIEELTNKAEQGDPESQYILGTIYSENKDHNKAKYYLFKAALQNFGPAEYRFSWYAKNEKEEVEWLLRAASHDNGRASIELAKRYIDGVGLKKNKKKAVQFLEKAANLGYQFEVADIYEYKIHDLKKALKWYIKASENGCSDSQEALGEIYEFGRGVTIDYKEALKWYNKAIENGSVYAEFRKGIFYYFGRAVELDYKKAKELWEHVSEQKNHSISDHAKQWLGYLYFYGNGVEINFRKAFDYFKSSLDGCKWHHLNSMYMIGKMYEEGLGVEQNSEHALYWYKQAAGDVYEEYYEFCRKYDYPIIKKQGDETAQERLGEIYYFGEIVKQDYKKAYEYFQKSSDQGNSYSQLYLGMMYYYGYFVEKNTFEAFFYYKRAADQGIGLAMYLVASMYSIGDGVKKNESLADLWFERAANYFRKFK